MRGILRRWRGAKEPTPPTAPTAPPLPARKCATFTLTYTLEIPAGADWPEGPLVVDLGRGIMNIGKYGDVSFVATRQWHHEPYAVPAEEPNA